MLVDYNWNNYTFYQFVHNTSTN